MSVADESTRSHSPQVGGRTVKGWLFALIALLTLATLSGCGLPGIGPATPQPTPTITPTPRPSEGVLYEDTLTDHPSGWPDAHGCSPQSDGYHVKGNTICPAPLPSLPSNVEIRVTVRAVTIGDPISTSYGIVFRYKDKQNYYGFEITPDGKYVFYKEVNNKFNAIVDYTFVGVIQMGGTAVNTLEIQAHGSHYAFYDDGAPVGQGDDTTFTTGGCGVDGSANTEVIYTDIRIDSPKK